MGSHRNGERHRLLVRYALALTWLLAASTALADVTVQNPIAGQLPQIARPGTSYSWAFGSATFASTNTGHTISYEAQGLPPWASFDPSSRAVSGTPAEGDAGTATITIVASEEGGQSSRDSFDLVTRPGRGATVNKPLPGQLPQASSLSPGNILPGGEQHVPLGWSFSIGFAGDTFVSPTGSVRTSARLADGNPLPTWLHYDPTLTLWGLAPVSPGTAGATIPVVVSASTVEGHSDVSSTVVLVVSGGALTLARPLLPINATAGSPITHSVEAPQVLLDGRAPDGNSNVDVALDTSSFPWLNYDAASRQFTGTPPYNITGDDASALNIPIRITDSQKHDLQTNLTLNVFPSVFVNATLPDMAVPPSAPFRIDLAKFVRARQVNLTSVNVTFDPPSARQWINVDGNILSLSGMAPADEQSKRVKVTLGAIDPRTSSKSSTFFNLAVSKKATPGQPQDVERPAQGGGHGLSTTAKIALAASLGSVAGLVLLVLLMMCCRRCCAAEDHDTHGRRLDYDISADDDRTLTEGKSPMMVFGAKNSPLMQKWRRAKHKDHASPYLHAGQSPYTEKRIMAGLPISAKSSRDDLSKSGSQVSITMQNEAPKPSQGQNPTKSKLLGFLRSKSYKSGQNLARDAALNNANRQAQVVGSIGLGLEGIVDGDNPYADPSQPLGHSRSHARSSWESDLWVHEESRAQTPGSGSVTISIASGDSRSESPTEVPVRRGGLVPMRHRNAHINDSPAFNLSHGFDTRSSDAHDHARPQHHLANMTTSATMDEDLDAGVITHARKVQVKPTGIVMAPQPVTIQAGQRSTSHRVVQVDDSNTSAFEDADDEPAHVDEVVRRRQMVAISGDQGKRHSYMPGLDGADISAVRFDDGPTERVLVRPEETMRAVRPSNVPLPPTPQLPVGGGGADKGLDNAFNPAAPGNTDRRRLSTISNSGRHQKEQHVQVVPGEMVRVKALSGFQAPPIMGGAPDSPGKRSGKRHNYVPVLQDEAYLEYWNTRPAFLEWLTWDARMQELSGTVPPKFGPTPISLRIAILARPVWTPQQQAPPSPALGSGVGVGVAPSSSKASPSKRHSRASSIESTATAVDEEVVAIVVLHIQKANFEGPGGASIDVQRGHAF